MSRAAGSSALRSPAMAPETRSTAGAAFRCELATEFSALERVARDWERLFRAAPPAGGMFQSWEWTRAFWNVHGAGLSLCTPVLFHGDRVVGILPAAVQGRTARLLGAPYADYNGLLCEPEFAERAVPAMFASLLAAPVPWQQCLFEGVRDSSPLLAVNAARMPAWLRARQQVTFAHACPTVVNDGTVFDVLSRKDSLRRHEKRLARRGTLGFRHVDDRDEILTRHLDRFIQMQITRQALNGVRSAFLSPHARDMIRALVAGLDPARELRFSVLELDTDPIAYHLGLEHAGKYMSYMPTFDVNLWKDGPGEVLLRNLLKYAHERRLSEFDFTIGDEEYKQRFANLVRRTFTVYVDRQPYRPAVQVRRLVRGVTDTVRQNPGGLRRARSLRAFVRRIFARRVKFPFGARLLLNRLVGEATIACQGIRRVPPPGGVRVVPLTLSGLARLRLEHRSLDDRTVHAMRRRMDDEKGYVASVGSSEHVFWVRVPRQAMRQVEGGPSALGISAGPNLDGTLSRTFTDALAALLCAVRTEGEVRVRSVHRGAVRAAARRAGYAVAWPPGTPADADASACPPDDRGEADMDPVNLRGAA